MAFHSVVAAEEEAEVLVVAIAVGDQTIPH